MIFFSLGLASILLNKADLLTNTSAKLNQYIDTFRSYANLEKDLPSKDIPVFGVTPLESTANLIIGTTQFEKNSYIIRQVREGLEQRYEKVVFQSVADPGRVFPNILETVKKNNTENIFGLAIGQKEQSSISVDSDVMNVTLFFLLPESFEKEMTTELRRIMNVHKVIRMSRINTGIAPVYRISWDSQPKEADLALTIIGLLDMINSFKKGNSI